MNYHHEILRYLPAQATAAGFIPVMLLADGITSPANPNFDSPTFAGPAGQSQLPLKLMF